MGYLTGEEILNNSSSLLDKDIFICGPGPFMDALRKQLLALGVKRKNIHMGKFSF